MDVRVQEAAPVDQRSSVSSTDRLDFPGSKHQQHTWQMHAMSAGIGPRGPFLLDLHGLSKSAARLALQNVSLLVYIFSSLLAHCCQAAARILHGCLEEFQVPRHVFEFCSSAARQRYALLFSSVFFLVEVVHTPVLTLQPVLLVLQ